MARSEHLVDHLAFFAVVHAIRPMLPASSVALLAASSAMSETIPPSLILITIGSVTGVSIAALFIGGLLPAAVGAVALGIIAFFRAHGEVHTEVKRPKAMVIGKTFLIALPALILPLIIRFSVVEGVATATEVSPVGVVYSLLVGPIFYKKLRCARWLALSQNNRTGRG